MFNVQILRNIDKRTNIYVNLESVITRHDENVYRLLSELTILTTFIIK